MQLGSRWDTLVWPRWLPVRARRALIAQITGAVALTALLMGPWWARVPEREPMPATLPVPHPVAVKPVVAPHSPTAHQSGMRPAHLNLDVRHAFGSLDLTVIVDGTTALNTRLQGSGKRFKVFGKRSGRGYTRTLDLTPGVRVVRIRARSAGDKFDHTRIERFDLASAAVATIRINAEKSGLSLIAERPSASARADSDELRRDLAGAASGREGGPAPSQAPAAIVLPAAPPPVEASAWSLELLSALRSMLIAIAGFVASAATGFIVQEFLRTRRRLFAEAEQAAAPKRRRAGFAG